MRSKIAKRAGKPDPAILKGIVDAVVRAAQPEKIVLFGSAARGEMGPDSDIDILVVKSGKYSHDRVTVRILRELTGDAAVDAIVVTPEHVERYRNTHCMVVCPALREGRVIYEAKPAVRPRRSTRVASSSQKQSRARPRRRPRRRSG